MVIFVLAESNNKVVDLVFLVLFFQLFLFYFTKYSPNFRSTGRSLPLENEG